MNFFEGIVKLFSTAKYMESMMEGLKMTLIISFFAALLGLLLGILVALVSIAKGSKWMKIPQALCKLYITVVRGTPMALQLFIMFYVIFTFRGFPEVVTAVIAFGFNSGAYVAEIIRGGIMSIDQGQMEAGRSLGFGYVPTMRFIILPQAFKTVLPTLANEFIVLLKETAVAGYVGLCDITYAGNIIGGNVYDYLFPLLMSAMIYLALVMFFTYLVGKLERRLRTSER
jgi:His/Glu/Gln/Arg/opine family amino acid ABC transporter permease subunit